MHHAALGMEDALTTLEIWMRGRAGYLEAAVEALLARGFTIYLTSDHGHTESTGIGQPSESRLMVQSRSRRARLYADRLLAHSQHALLPGTAVWEQDGLLPREAAALLPDGRGAFAPVGSTVVTHGGISIDEVVVPLVKITT